MGKDLVKAIKRKDDTLNRKMHIKPGKKGSSMSSLPVKITGRITAITGLKKAGSKNSLLRKGLHSINRFTKR